MFEYELNGEGFHYLVSYKRLDESNGPELKQAVRDWRQGSLQAHTLDDFHAYIIFVQAVNNEGFAPVNQLQKYVAFSGEGSKYQTLLQVFGLTYILTYLLLVLQRLLITYMMYSQSRTFFSQRFFFCKLRSVSLLCIT